MAQPFIITAALPKDLGAWAEGLRRAHYPVERNQIHAHVTLFHSFAPSLLEELRDFLPRVVAEFTAPAGAVASAMDLGTGTAIALKAPQLLALRGLIADHFHGSLTVQDTISKKQTRARIRTRTREAGAQPPGQPWSGSGAVDRQGPLYLPCAGTAPLLRRAVEEA